MKIQELTKAIYNEFKNKVTDPINTVQITSNYFAKIDTKNTEVKMFFEFDMVTVEYKGDVGFLIAELEAKLAQANLLIEAKEPIALAV